jgi:hypothetical protein
MRRRERTERARRPPPSADVIREERRARRTRAVEEPLDVRPRDDLPFPSLEVSNPLHQTRYRVLLPGYPARDGAMCTCTDFARRGIGTCKHLEAGWIWLEANPLPNTHRKVGRKTREIQALWREIELRQSRLPAPADLRGVDLRAPGAVLV